MTMMEEQIHLRTKIGETLVRDRPGFFDEMIKEMVREVIIKPLFSNQRPGTFDPRRFRRRMRQVFGKTGSGPR